MKAHLIGLLLAACLTGGLHAQTKTIALLDSFHIQRASLQDTFLLRVIPDYINRRMKEAADVDFHKKGVILVIIPKTRLNTLIRYRIQTEYDNYYLLLVWASARPLFYTQVNGRYVVVCDEWTGALMPISMLSQNQTIDEFVESGWLDRVVDYTEARTEIHSAVYTWRPKEQPDH